MARTYKFIPEDPAVRLAAENAVFGHAIGDEVYGDLIGDTTGDAAIEVAFNEEWPSKGKVYPIRICADCPIYKSVVRLDQGEFDYSDCTAKVKGQKHGRAILKLAAETACGQGFTQMNAAGSKWSIPQLPQHATYGYYVYAKYGFDAPLPPEIVAKLPEGLKAATHLRHLVATDAGRKFWKKEGVRMNKMTFLLAEGSDSWATFDANY